MYLYSFKNLHILIRQTDYYKSKKRKDYQELIIDKCNQLVHHILYLQKKHKTDTVHLSSTILKQNLGSHYYTHIVKILLDVGIIRKGKSYTKKSYYTKGKSKQYRFTELTEDMKVVKVAVLTKSTERRMKTIIADLKQGITAQVKIDQAKKSKPKVYEYDVFDDIEFW